MLKHRKEWDGKYKYKFKSSGTFMFSCVLNTHSFSDCFCLRTQGLLRVKKKRSGCGNRRTRGQYKFLFRPPGGSKVLRFIEELEIRISCDSYGLGLPANIFLVLYSASFSLFVAGSLAARGKIVVGGTPNRLNYCVIFIQGYSFVIRPKKMRISQRLFIRF